MGVCRYKQSTRQRLDDEDPQQIMDGQQPPLRGTSYRQSLPVPTTTAAGNEPLLLLFLLSL